MPDDSMAGPRRPQSTRGGLTLDERMAVVEARLQTLESESRRDREQRDREHRENQHKLTRIEGLLETLKSIADRGEARIDSLEQTRDEQVAVLKVVRIVGTIAAAMASIGTVLTIVIATVHR